MESHDIEVICHSKSCQAIMIDFYVFIFYQNKAASQILDVWQSSEYASRLPSAKYLNTNTIINIITSMSKEKNICNVKLGPT